MSREACCFGHSPLRKSSTSDLSGESSPEVALWAWNLLSKRGKSLHPLLGLWMPYSQGLRASGGTLTLSEGGLLVYRVG